MDSLSRRNVLVGGVTLTALAAVGTRVASAQPAPPSINALATLERRNNARIGVYAVDLQSQQVVAHRPAERYAMCSTFKTYAAARVLQKAERAELSLTDTVIVDADDILPHSPVTETRVGQTITLGELCAAALEQSDNAASNYLLDAIGGPPAVTEFARSLGDKETRLDRWEPELNSASPGDLRDTSTPESIGVGYRALLIGSALGSSVRDQLTDWMRANVTSSMRPGMPPNWVLADKTGSGAYGITNDVGIAFGPDGRQVLLSVMVRSEQEDPDAEGFRPMMAEVAALVMSMLIH